MVDKISLPVMIPDRLLISPGIWNGDEYSEKEINEAFGKTNWGDKTKISLWLNHDDTNTSAFVGYVKNPKLASQGRVFGDLELWDEKTATILTQAMAKFGISAKIKGEEDKKGKMHNFTFENFSVVTVPACDDAYINLAKIKLVSKYLISNFNTNERRLENMAEEEKKEEVVEKKPEETKAEPEKELSEKEMLKELSVKFDKLISLLSKKLEDEEPAKDAIEAKVEVAEEEKEEEKPEEAKAEVPAEEAKEEPKAEEENKELTEVKKELALIKEKLNAPKSKTIRNLSSNNVGDDAKYSQEEFANFLTEIDKPMKFM